MNVVSQQEYIAVMMIGGLSVQPMGRWGARRVEGGQRHWDKCTAFGSTLFGPVRPLPAAGRRATRDSCCGPNDIDPSARDGAAGGSIRQRALQQRTCARAHALSLDSAENQSVLTNKTVAASLISAALRNESCAALARLRSLRARDRRASRYRASIGTSSCRRRSRPAPQLHHHTPQPHRSHSRHSRTIYARVCDTRKHVNAAGVARQPHTL